MGVNCKLLTEKGVTDLDRAYCFLPTFKEETIYGRDECMRLLAELSQRDYGDDTEYRCFWIRMALENVGEKNLFLTETSYFDESLLLERIENGEPPGSVIDDIAKMRAEYDNVELRHAKYLREHDAHRARRAEQRKQLSQGVL